MVRIAVVNDDTTFLSLMSAVLAERGWDAVEYREGDTAYDALKRDPPDLVILDVRLSSPENGWQVAELLKLDPETRHIPIIVCSAALDELEAKRTWLLDHNIGVLPKPFDIDDLYASVEATLRPVTGEP